MFKSKKHIIKCAIHRATGESIHIDSAGNGLSCGCYCIICNKDFEAVQGKSHKREWHFRHKGDKFNRGICAGGIETALHKLAKQIISKNNSILLPKYGEIRYTDAIAGKKSPHYPPRCDSGLQR